MRPTDAHHQERLLALFQRHIDAGRAAGLIGVRVEDAQLDPAYMTVQGRRISNFGLCSYLGLSTDARLKRGRDRGDGAIRARLLIIGYLLGS